MKRVGLIALILSAAAVANAWEIEKNPDRYPSIGLDVSSGRLAGLPKGGTPIGSLIGNTAGISSSANTDGKFVAGQLDVRLPVSSALTVHAFGSSTSVNNNLQFTDGHSFGAGLRVYLQ